MNTIVDHESIPPMENWSSCRKAWNQDAPISNNLVTNLRHWCVVKQPNHNTHECRCGSQYVDSPPIVLKEVG